MLIFSNLVTAQSWLLNGNAAPVGSFLGTTNATPLEFKINNISSGRLDFNDNAFYGLKAGFNSVNNNVNSISNSFIGANAGYSNANGVRNLFIGAYAGYYNNGTTTGSNANGSDNSFLGAYSGKANTTGSDNVFVGAHSGISNQTGYSNVFIGRDAGHDNQTGFSNVFMGRDAGFSTNALGNTFLGFEAGRNTIGTTNPEAGSWNTFVGRHTGFKNTTGSDNTLLGNYADVVSGNLTNATAIGCMAVVNTSYKVRIGSLGVNVIEGNGFFATSDARFKSNVSEKVAGLNLIMRLKPVTYNFNYTKFSDFLGEKEVDKSVLAEKETQIEMGFLAQDVEKVLKETGLNVSNLVHLPESERDNYSLAYAQLVVPLVKAVQEQQKIIEQQNTKIESLEARLQKLEAALSNNKDLLPILSGSSISKKDNGNAYLGQNAPNPFDGSTSIAYELPQNIKMGTLLIHNLEGKELKSFKLSNCCGTIQINAKDFPNGALIYSLFADGQLLESKKMILSK